MSDAQVWIMLLVIISAIKQNYVTFSKITIGRWNGKMKKLKINEALIHMTYRAVLGDILKIKNKYHVLK